MREAQTIVIGECTYAVAPLPPRKATALLADIVRIVGPGLAPLLDQADGDGPLVEQNIAGAALAAGVRGLLEQLDSDRVQSVLDRLILSVTTVTSDNAEIPRGVIDSSAKYDAHFGAVGLGPLFQLVPFALKVQFGDFTSVLGSVAGGLRSTRSRPAAGTSKG